MGHNVNYNYWVENIQKMNEEELLGIIHNSGGYNQEYIQIVKERLSSEFHHSQEELDNALVNAEVKYHTEKIAEETDRQISLLGKAIAIVSLIVLNVFGIIGILLIRSKKIKNSLGDKHYLYNNDSREWLLYCLIFYFGLCLVFGVIEVILIYL